jgi:ferredoxin
MVKVDKKKCIGCGLCVSICEEVFKLDNDGKAEVKAQKKLPCVKEAKDSCPVSAITE